MYKDIYWVRTKLISDLQQKADADNDVVILIGREFSGGSAWKNRIRHIRSHRCRRFFIYCSDLKTEKRKRLLGPVVLLVPARSRYWVDVHGRQERINWITAISGLVMLIIEGLVGLILISISSMFVFILMLSMRPKDKLLDESL